MVNSRLWIPALVVAATALPLAAQDKGAKDVAPAAAIHIGVVDLDRAIERYAWAVGEQKRLAELADKFTEEIAERRKAIEELRGQLSLLKPGSDKFYVVDLQLKLAINEHDGVYGLRQRQLDNEREDYNLLVYEDIEFVIARVAEARGIDIVMRAQPAYEPDAQDADDPATLKKRRLGQYSRRTVFFTSPRVDLTPHVIQYLQTFDPRAERKAAEAAAAAKSGNSGADSQKDPNGDKNQSAGGGETGKGPDSGKSQAPNGK